MTSNSTASGGTGRRSRQKLDLQTRIEVLRLAARGQPHPEPEVSAKAYRWASDRLRVAPLRRELLIVTASFVLMFTALIAVWLPLDDNKGTLGGLIILALGATVGCCGWTVYMHRRVEKVARLNRPS